MDKHGCKQCRFMADLIREQLEDKQTAFLESEEAERSARLDGDFKRATEEQARQKKIAISVTKCSIRLAEIESCSLCER